MIHQKDVESIEVAVNYLDRWIKNIQVRNTEPIPQIDVKCLRQAIDTINRHKTLLKKIKGDSLSPEEVNLFTQEKIVYLFKTLCGDTGSFSFGFCDQDHNSGEIHSMGTCSIVHNLPDCLKSKKD